MTTPEAIQSAYRWAMQVQNDKKSGIMLLYCAAAVTRAIEDSQSDEAAYMVILKLLEEWQARESFRPAIVAVRAAMGLKRAKATTA